MKRFEYMSEGFDTNKLNELGALGWEAVGVVTDPQFNEHDRSRVDWNIHTVLLKRRVKEPKHRQLSDHENFR